MPYTVRPLDASTWDPFAELVERNNGIFGGCWCIGFHPERARVGLDARTAKEARVRSGQAHAALVFDEEGLAQGWAQYGDPEELSNIKHKREYDKDAPPRPDWRIACLFVDKRHRGQGVAHAAVAGAPAQIAEAGGGAGRGCLGGDRGPRGARQVPVQRDRRAHGAARVLPDPSGRQARVDREPDGRPGLSASPW